MLISRWWFIPGGVLVPLAARLAGRVETLTRGLCILPFNIIFLSCHNDNYYLPGFLSNVGPFLF